MQFLVLICVSVCTDECQQDSHIFLTGILQQKPEKFAMLHSLVAYRIAYRWHDVGIQLKIDIDELDEIDQNNTRVPVEVCCKKMLTKWKKSNKDVTPDKLIDAVKTAAGNAAYAAKLRKGEFV